MAIIITGLVNDRGVILNESTSTLRKFFDF